MILRRRGDLASVMRDLGGELFAREGNVDKYFKFKLPVPLEGEITELRFIDDVPNEEEVSRAVMHLVTYRRNKMLDAIHEHIRTAPERERAALRRANIRQACGIPPKGWPR